MNISRIRNMAASGDMSLSALRYLLDCHGECEHLDFKESLDLDSDYGCASAGKDIVAMKNIGGGYVVVGVEDQTWVPKGMASRLPVDTKGLRDKVRKSTALEIETDIVHHETFVNGSSKLFALILVRSSSKRSKLRAPSICKASFRAGEPWGIRQGDIYIRDSDTTKRLDDPMRLETLLNDLEFRYQEADLAEANSVPSPFAVESGLYRLLPREYDVFVGRSDLKAALREAVEKDPRIWIINLHGPGGVGKSALATWLAYEYYHEKRYDAILHLSAKNAELTTDRGICQLTPTLVSLENLFDRVLRLFEHSEYCSCELSEQRRTVEEILRAYSTLIILDNMETVNDGRIMEFVGHLPVGSQAKVLLTSRRRTSQWEYPIQVTELNTEETQEFVRVCNEEMRLDLPVSDAAVIERLAEKTGGLPLAIKWTLGEYAKTRNLKRIIERAEDPSSPLLEFSFRNSWQVLDSSGQQALAVLSIFEEPPTGQLWRTALDWPVDRVDKAIAALTEVTFVAERTEQKTGKLVYSALPITLTFARNELIKMGDLEKQARLRYQSYQNAMDLAAVETTQYTDLFEQYDAKTDLQKRAIILGRMAEGQARSLGYDAAHQYYKQALELDPRSVYVLVSYALFKLELSNYGEAEELMKRAAERCTKKTGYYVYYNMSRVYDSVHDRHGKIRALRKALEYDPNRTVAQHQLGVALSQNGNFEEALAIFDSIIEAELARPTGPRDWVIYATKTKVITLRHAKRDVEAQRVIADGLKLAQQYNEISYLAPQLQELLDQ